MVTNSVTTKLHWQRENHSLYFFKWASLYIGKQFVSRWVQSFAFDELSQAAAIWGCYAHIHLLPLGKRLLEASLGMQNKAFIF